MEEEIQVEAEGEAERKEKIEGYGEEEMKKDEGAVVDGILKLNDGRDLHYQQTGDIHNGSFFLSFFIF